MYHSGVRKELNISIHALREEGDLAGPQAGQGRRDFYPRPPRGGRRTGAATSCHSGQFLSTPSARRATWPGKEAVPRRHISIHALREEGDAGEALRVGGVVISIHALREEGDTPSKEDLVEAGNFYPRPPRGGRPYFYSTSTRNVKFLSTPSARRATVVALPISSAA